jgi:hypothetical protein
MGGGQTSRKSESARWRVITSGETAAVEFVSNDHTYQFGLRAGEGDTIYFGETLVRLGGAGGC